MNARTREQLLELNRVFYEAHAEAFDRSRGARPWPGWLQLAALLEGARPALVEPGAHDSPAIASPSALGAVLDIGCGNGRFACFLHEAGFRFAYTGVDANATLLASARRQLPASCAEHAQLLRHDFLAGGPSAAASGSDLPSGPFALVVLMGVLHHVPGAGARLDLLRSAAGRLEPGGRLAFATWLFESDPREERKRVSFSSAGPVLGQSIDEAELEPGDALLRFGPDPAAAPRYCHAVAAGEFESWPEALGLERLADYQADGPRGDSNRYAILRRP